MSRHRADVRPRWGRISALTLAVTVTGVALLGGTGLLPSSAHEPSAADQIVRTSAPVPGSPSQSAQRLLSQTPTPSELPSVDSDAPVTAAPGAALDALPADSGTGRRVVFSQSRQRVWLADDDGVQHTYLVSGSVTGNLKPGTYRVYSKSQDAVGVDDSGTMKWFVRFTQGPSGAAIGFHNIPVKDGHQTENRSELGTPRSHGCIRQTTHDAKTLWAFAPIGTTVVVTA